MESVALWILGVLFGICIVELIAMIFLSWLLVWEEFRDR